ncbi:MAG: SLOG family protein [Bacteroidales bacterium]|nr:SLOG family protein [Bacteroidales bacterium]
MNVAVIISGSRDFSDYIIFEKFISRAIESIKKYNLTFIHGDAMGADKLAIKYCRSTGYEIKAFPADWQVFGKCAGVLRNQEMLDYAIKNFDKAVLIAFPSKQGRGTQHMIKICKEAGVPIRICEID